ncbi:MAG: bi-domain-containing oxidoreductase [Conexivisphaerales archaeon]
MKQVVARAGKIEVIEVPEPVCSPDEVLVRNLYSLISTGTESWTAASTKPIGTRKLLGSESLIEKAIKLSTDVLRKEGIDGFTRYIKDVRNPVVPLGYSCAGKVVAVGKNIRDIVVGDNVACAGEAMATHSEVASVPRNLLVKVPSGVELKEAAFATVGAIALHAFRQGRAQVLDNIAVIGCGLIGNLLIQVANAAGCRVFAVDISKDRLKLAENSGAQSSAEVSDPELLSKANVFTDGIGFDEVYICAASQSSEPINLASELCRNRGRLIVVGRVGMNIDRKNFYQKELELVMSRSLGPGRYDPLYEVKGIDYPLQYVRWTLNRNMAAFLELIKRKNVNVLALVGGEYPIERAAEAYDSIAANKGIATLLYYAREEKKVAEEINGIITKTKGKNHKINVALVGPGSFARDVMLPLLKKNKDYNLYLLVSSDPVHAERFRQRYGFQRSTCNYEDALKDEMVDLIFITAPNNLHFELTLSAIKAKKPVFVEKPLCLTREELAALVEAYRASTVPVVVGFNRRYAPAVIRLKEEIRKLNGPFMISYRANVGFIKNDSWTHDPAVGGGRIIHECCHFIDLFNFLLDEYEAEVRAVSAGINKSTSVDYDNISIILSYPSGSIASLIYTALGSNKMERERLELFANGRSFVIQDFRTFEIYSESNTRESMTQDKGWKKELEELSKLLRGEKNSIIPFKEAVASTELTLKVADAVRNIS